MSAATIRPVRPDEIEALAALHGRAFPPAERWGAVAIRAMLAMEGAFGLAADVAGGGCGGFILARAVAGEAEVLTLAVDPSQRRQGLGGRLLAAALAESARRGAETLFLEVSEANAPARALYARASATEIGRRRRYYADGSDALVLAIRQGEDTLLHRPA
ncbi:ribosomal-protein-alanine N-acetyltransferase [Roseomonas rosea]|uniref:Ribosomal-protein-alanine N-acetyltransferase n=1 Tax=Muricoccus roseus TaxID=198092 RepID=A0A1M6A7G1_9PROT|nr:GNAT family N-acetyltransferase [Roseomonas rosea]SHI32401.1 ribosomal-protein-alanine N-acetyltransferase [Roseomonas rosea]